MIELQITDGELLTPAELNELRNIKINLTRVEISISRLTSTQNELRNMENIIFTYKI